MNCSEVGKSGEDEAQGTGERKHVNEYPSAAVGREREVGGRQAEIGDTSW